MRDTDREARLEEVRGRAEARYSFPKGRTKALSDIDWLLSEIDRLKAQNTEAYNYLNSAGITLSDREAVEEAKTKLEGEDG